MTIKSSISDVESLERALSDAASIDDRKIGQVLVGNGNVSEDDLARALELQKASGGKKLGEILVAMGALSSQDVTEALYAKLGIPSVDLEAFKIAVDATQKLAPALAEEHAALPIAVLDGGKTLVVATPDPLDDAKRKSIGFATGMTVLLVHAPKDAVAQGTARGQAAAGVARAVRDYAYAPNAHFHKHLTLDELVSRAVEEDALAINLRVEDGAATILFRTEEAGLVEHPKIALSEYKELSRKIKAAALIGEAGPESKFAEGRAKTVCDGVSLDLRIVVAEAVMGETISIDLFPGTAEMTSIDTLGLSLPRALALKEEIKHPGITLVAAGSMQGRSTTAYALIRELCDAGTYVITVEDVIRERISGAEQFLAPQGDLLGKSAAISTAISRRPNVLLIDELDDPVSVKAAFAAAAMGIKVVATYTAEDAVDAIASLLEEGGVDPIELCQGLSGVMAQTLTITNCEHCMTVDAEAEDERDLPQEEVYYYTPGCDRCHESRTTLVTAEIIPVTAEIRHTIMNHAMFGRERTDDIRNDLLLRIDDAGIETMRDELIRAVCAGRIARGDLADEVHSAFE
jgi:type II secretory ATPase GspE/PulE/Tfp pilus assembly ATPase PilB-like protein